MKTTTQEALDLLQKQLVRWPEARERYEALVRVKTKEITVAGYRMRVQFNPARILSSAAKIDPDTLRKRPCFLCAANRPAEQLALTLDSRYELLVNPYPIFNRHFTIAEVHHVPQRIQNRFEDMLALAACLDRFVLFYNGPFCGASAPDHMHFQAGNKGFLPLEEEWEKATREQLYATADSRLSVLRDYLCPVWVLESENCQEAASLCETLCTLFPKKIAADEPMLNLLVLYEAGLWRMFFFLRAAHRPACYYKTGKYNLLISPASVDMGGVLVLPQEKDFDKITAEDIHSIWQEVCLDEAAHDRVVSQICKTIRL